MGSARNWAGRCSRTLRALFTRHYTFNGTPVATRVKAGLDGVRTIIADHHNTGMISIPNGQTAGDVPPALTRQRLDPYGVARTSATWPNDRGFLNKPTDTTGLTQIGARYYDPVRARFITPDPLLDLKDPQQWNGYTYANNNPTTYSDPTGLAPGNNMVGAWDKRAPIRKAINPMRGLPYQGSGGNTGCSPHPIQGPRSIDLPHYDPDIWTDVNGESTIVNALQSWAVGSIDAMIFITNIGILVINPYSASMLIPEVGKPNDPELGYGWSYALGGVAGPHILLGAVRFPAAGGSRSLFTNNVPARFITTGGGVTIDRAAVNTTVSPQRQGRHVLGARQYGGGSYLNSVDDAQRVLDDFHSGAAEILGVKGSDIVVRAPGVTGINVNPGAGFPNQLTNVFFVKGSGSPSVVPYNPMWMP